MIVASTAIFDTYQGYKFGSNAFWTTKLSEWIKSEDKKGREHTKHNLFREFRSPINSFTVANNFNLVL